MCTQLREPSGTNSVLIFNTCTNLSPKNIVDYMVNYLTTIIKTRETSLVYSSIKVYMDFLGQARSFTHPQLLNPVQHPEVELFLWGVAQSLGKKVDKAEPCQLDHIQALNQAALMSLKDKELQTAAWIVTLTF